MSLKNGRLCYKCNKNYVNVVDHCISECPYLHLERTILWDKIHKFNPQAFIFLRKLDKVSLTSVMLDEELNDLNTLLNHNSPMFWSLCISHMHVMWSKYNNI